LDREAITMGGGWRRRSSLRPHPGLPGDRAGTGSAAGKGEETRCEGTGFRRRMMVGVRGTRCPVKGVFEIFESFESRMRRRVPIFYGERR
jgi:hypothetical protein